MTGNNHVEEWEFLLIMERQILNDGREYAKGEMRALFNYYDGCCSHQIRDPLNPTNFRNNYISMDEIRFSLMESYPQLTEKQVKEVANKSLVHTLDSDSDGKLSYEGKANKHVIHDILPYITSVYRRRAITILLQTFRHTTLLVLFFQSF